MGDAPIAAHGADGNPQDIGGFFEPQPAKEQQFRQADSRSSR
jgi:hypothetical protein